MKREFLTNLGLDTEQVTKIMAEHGKTVNSLKDELDKVDEIKTQVTDLQGQLKDRDKQLEELSNKAKGNEELTKEIETLKEQNKQTAKDYQEKIDKQAFDFMLEKAISQAQAKNPKAVKALLNMENIKLDGDKLIGFEDQLTALKESDGYLFGEDSKLGGRKPNDNHNIPPGMKNPFSNEHFNLTEQARILKEDPELAKQLKALA